MTPYYADERAVLHSGDSLAVLAGLETGSASAVVTDPPYSSGGMVRSDRMQDTVAKYVSSQNTHKSELISFSGDSRDQRSYSYWCALWLGEALRVTAPGGVCLLFTDWRQLPATTDALQAGGWVWRGVVPWVKPSPRPQAGRFSAQCEYVVWGSHGAMPVDLSAPCLPGFFEATPPRDREHITQKPLDVMRGLVRIAPPGEIVLDPFMGSGTTGVAAMLEGRRFIGVEMVGHYRDVAERRIREAQGQSVARAEQDSLDFGDAS